MSFIWGNFIIEAVLLIMAADIHTELEGVAFTYHGMVWISVFGMVMSLHDFCNAFYKQR